MGKFYRKKKTARIQFTVLQWFNISLAINNESSFGSMGNLCCSAASGHQENKFDWGVRGGAPL